MITSAPLGLDHDMSPDAHQSMISLAGTEESSKASSWAWIWLIKSIDHAVTILGTPPESGSTPRWTLAPGHGGVRLGCLVDLGHLEEHFTWAPRRTWSGLDGALRSTVSQVQPRQPGRQCSMLPETSPSSWGQTPGYDSTAVPLALHRRSTWGLCQNRGLT